MSIRRALWQEDKILEILSLCVDVNVKAFGLDGGQRTAN